MKSLLTKTMLAVGLALGAPTTQADPVTWTLNNVSFDDGGTASGWFVFDASAWNDDQQKLGVFGDFDIQTTAGTRGLSWHYSSSDGNNFAWHIDMWDVAHSLAWAANEADQPWIDFVFSSPLTDAGGTVAVAGGWEAADLGSVVYRTLTGGSVSTAAANDLPEPGALALASVALFGLCMSTRRQRRRLGLRA